MAKLRWTLLLFALGIALPATLIVLRATESLELENSFRHETVAERIFDEMERSLSDFLLREEARPPGDYSTPGFDGGPASADRSFGPPSEAFDRADEAFILGWFSLDGSGKPQVLARQQSNRSRIEVALNEAHGPRADSRAFPQESEALAEYSKKGVDPVVADLKTPAPGRTQSLGHSRTDRLALAEDAPKDAKESNAYEVLQNLNRAGSLRSERQSRALRKSDSRTGSAEASAAPKLEQKGGVSKPASPIPPSSPSSFSALAPLEGEESPDPAPLDQDQGAAPQRMLEAVARDEGQNAPIVDPLIGRETEGGTLVLTRSVWHGERVERQGIVLDRPSLIAWLSGQVLTQTGLAQHAKLDFTAIAGSTSEGEHRYLHRFAEPFDDLTARLDLEPLPGLGTTRAIHALALLLALSGLIGLYAVDRMTRVVLEFAQRRSNFVAAVSHELKTPLTAIRMYGEMLRDGLVSSESRRAEYYATITDESERLSRLIDNVLEFSRLEQNQRDLDLVVGGLADAVRTASEKLRTRVEREGFDLLLDLPETLPRVHYDRDAITQILFNLVDNALKYARGADLKTIEIRLAAKSNGVELGVRDHGPGVSPSQCERIFEPFYRIGEELTRTTEGTGIGLALVRELSSEMGGSVRAARPTQGGFEVVVTLPPAQ
jgi:signal transduction histidine kinase